MLENEYRSINVSEGAEDRAAEDYSLFGFRLVNKETIVLRGDQLKKTTVVYGNNGPHVMEKPRKSDVIHYVKLTFARKVGGPNYSFYRKWGDVYENLRKDAAYLSVRSWNRGQDARPRWGRGILFFLLFALPIVVLYFLYGSKGMFDIAATMALGAYGLALVSFMGLVLLLVEIAIRAVALASSRRAAKDRKTIVEAIKTLIYQLRTTNDRPTIPFAKIARIERHYHAVEQD